MGDPRRIKNKYDTPIHPWEKLRLEAERPLMKEYGLVNKKELWKVSSKLKNFKDTAKKLVASKSSQAAAEKKQMVDRMRSYGLVSSEELDEILGLEVQSLLDRRLQTIVFRKGLARSVKQARQMIVHRHIGVNGVKVTAPGYLVKVGEEDSVSFVNNSKFGDESHPERFQDSLVKEKVVLDKKSSDKKELKEEMKQESSEAKEELKEELKKDVEEQKESAVSSEKNEDVKKAESPIEEVKERPKAKDEAVKDVVDDQKGEEPEKEKKSSKEPDAEAKAKDE